MARLARLVSISFPGVRGDMAPVDRARDAIDDVSRRIDDAALSDPDLIVLPETFTGLGSGGDTFFASAESIPGPTTDALSRKAREHDTHIVFGILERRDGALFNAAVLLGRDGSILGIYHKMHPTVGEIDAGVIPGTEAPVWSTDIGAIGCAVCFDLNFLDVADSLAQNGADIVCFPSMYRGGLSARLWAFHYGFWFISATPTENSVIIDPLGRLLVESFVYSPTIMASVNTDSVVCHIDFNHPKLGALRRKYGAHVDILTMAPEGVFMLTSRVPDVSVDDMVREFDLETRNEYWKRSNNARMDALAGIHRAPHSVIPLSD